MLTIYQPWLVKYKKIFFASDPSFSFGLNADFIQTNCSEKIAGFKKKTQLTKVIDLKLSLNDIIKNFQHSTYRELNKAEKEHMEFIPNFNDYKYFVDFYNDFVKLKGDIKSTNLEFFLINSKSIFINACKLENDILVMHSCLVDNDIKRVQAYQSASHFRIISDSRTRNRVSRANRYLHFCEMKYYKELGFEIYDMGGYSQNSKLAAINRFKDSFGGKIIEEYNFIPIYKYALEKIKIGSFNILTGR